MKEYGIVDSGDAKTNGIGAMTEARWRDFFDTMAEAGVYPADMDYNKAYTLRIRRQEGRDEALTTVPGLSARPRAEFRRSSSCAASASVSPAG